MTLWVIEIGISNHSILTQRIVSMITDFETLCLHVFVLVDDWCLENQHLFHRPGKAPCCSDSELLTMVLVADIKSWNLETQLLSEFRLWKHLFPHLPTQSRLNRRRKNLVNQLNQLRLALLAQLDLALLAQLDLALDCQCAIDSVPLPVVAFHLAPACSSEWAIAGAAFGKVPSKKQTIYGFNLHLLTTLGGVILDFELAPANETDLKVGEELLLNHQDKTVLGDKAYISAMVAEELEVENNIELLTIPRSNEKRFLPQWVQKLHNRFRQIVETVNGQLTEQFQLSKNTAHGFCGLCTRLLSKLTAHTICIFLNRQSGTECPLQIKKLATNQLA